MKLHVLLAKDTPNTEGLPPLWPVETRQGDKAPATTPWLEMTPEQFDAHVAIHTPAKEVWNQSRERQQQQAEAWQYAPSTRLHALRAVFALHGLEAKIDSAIASLPEPQRSIAKAHWNFGDVINRTHPLVTSLATMLDLTEAEVDEIFHDARTVESGGVPDIKPEEVSMWQRLLNLFT